MNSIATSLNELKWVNNHTQLLPLTNPQLQYLITKIDNFRDRLIHLRNPDTLNDLTVNRVKLIGDGDGYYIECTYTSSNSAGDKLVTFYIN